MTGHQEMRERMICLGGAFCVSVLLFLFLPLSYYLFHGELHDALLQGRKKIVPLETISLQKKKQPKKEKIERREKKALSKVESTAHRFNLDLSVLSEGEGEGMVSGARGRVIEDYEADVAPVKRFSLPPSYPARARQAGVAGTVTARILINERGEVETVRIIKAPRGWGFEASVKEALSRWRFEPAKLESMPVRVWARQEIEFSQ